MKKFKFIDLFAGIGGMRIPFEEMGGDCVFSSEIDKHAQQTYQYNFDEFPSGDITKISEKDIPHHNLLLAGFPCQAFSNAGLKKGFNDTRGTLFFEISRILRACHPEAFLLENVRGLRSHDGGKTLEIILNTLKEIGYQNLYTQILNAKDFGLPQNRARFFIVGFKNSDINFEFPKKLNIATKVGDILENCVEDKFTISDRLWKSHKERKARNLANNKGFGYSAFNEDSKYTRTISSRYFKDGSEALLLQKDKNPRFFTPREVARLQGFPDKFILNESNTQSYKQLGNAVPVNVISFIGKNILNSLNLS